LITAIVKFKLRHGLSYDEAIADIRHAIPLYQSQPALVRKQICLDLDAGEGRSFYLWRDRAAAEAFYDMARPILVQQTGAEPEIELLDTHVLVDNMNDEVFIA
jgi:hypothetical protein